MEYSKRSGGGAIMAGHLTGIRLAFVGDIHSFGTRSGYQYVCTDYVQYAKLLDAMFVVGDVTYDAAETEYDNVKDWMDKWATNTYLITGNHDMRNKILADEAERLLYQDRFKNKLGVTALNYTVQFGNCLFIAISTDAHLASDASPKYPGDGVMTAATKQFLVDTLAANQDKNIFVCSHQAPYDVTQWATERNGNIYYNSTEIQSILTQYRVDMWFYGHCHQAYKNGVVDISEPYDGTPPEFKNVVPTVAAPRSAAPLESLNGSNSTLFVPCWGGNKFYGSRIIESRYMELLPGATSVDIKARDHTNGIWQSTVRSLKVSKTLPFAIQL